MDTDRKEGVRLWELPRNSCHWHLGELLERIEFFCEAPTKPASPYCTEHRKQAFVRPYTARKEKPAGKSG